MKVLSYLALSLCLLSACVPKSDLDEANKKIAELQNQIAVAKAETEKVQAQVTATQAETERARAEIERTKEEAIAAKDENQKLTDKNSQLQAKVDEKPQLPVTVSFRKAMTGPGNVVVLNTTVKSNVPVLITLRSAALGTSKTFERHLDPTRITELGHLEGAVIENGDTITIENQNYSPVTFTVNL